MKTGERGFDRSNKRRSMRQTLSVKTMNEMHDGRTRGSVPLNVLMDSENRYLASRRQLLLHVAPMKLCTNTLGGNVAPHKHATPFRSAAFIDAEKSK